MNNSTKNLRVNKCSNLDSCEVALQEVIKVQQDADKYNGILQMEQFEVLTQEAALADTLVNMAALSPVKGENFKDRLDTLQEKTVNPKAYGCHQAAARGEFSLSEILKAAGL